MQVPLADCVTAAHAGGGQPLCQVDRADDGAGGGAEGAHTQGFHARSPVHDAALRKEARRLLP